MLPASNTSGFVGDTEREMPVAVQADKTKRGCQRNRSGPVGRGADVRIVAPGLAHSKPGDPSKGLSTDTCSCLGV